MAERAQLLSDFRDLLVQLPAFPLKVTISVAHWALSHEAEKHLADSVGCG